MLTPPPEVAALALALQDSIPPEVLFGVGGGTGFGRFVYGDHVTLLTRITTRETAREGFLAKVCHNLHVPCRMQVASSADALRKSLLGALTDSKIPVVWVQPDRLPWSGPPDAYQAVAVMDLGAAGASVFDGEEHTLPVDTLLAATRTPGARHRMLVVDGRPGDLGSAVRTGMQSHRDQMREGFGPPQTRSAFGLPGLARWAAQISADASAGPALAAQIEARGGGPGMREAQSAFLAYAGHERAAAGASTAAARWGELAAALRDSYAGPDQVRAVHDAEAEALAAAEAALRVC